MFGNITGDESTRSSEIDILIRIKNTKSFSKAKKAKVLNFRENSLALQKRTIATHWKSSKEELGFYQTITVMDVQKEDTKETERNREFFLIRGVLRTQSNI